MIRIWGEKLRRCYMLGHNYSKSTNLSPLTSPGVRLWTEEGMTKVKPGWLCWDRLENRLNRGLLRCPGFPVEVGRLGPNSLLRDVSDNIIHGPVARGNDP